MTLLKQNLHTSCLFSLVRVQPGLGIGGSDGQLGCPSRRGSAVLGGDVVSSQRGSAALQPRDPVDQELPDAAGRRVLCFRVTPVTGAGHQGLALESPVHPAVSASEFPPITLHFFFIFLFYC